MYLLTVHTVIAASLHADSVILIGMRASGKSLMGSALARGLNWKFVDIDEEFERSMGISIAAYVAAHAWEAFREAEVALFTDILRRHPRNTVVSTGGGLVETEAGRAALRAYHGLVLQLSRPIADVITTLQSDETRAKLGEHPHKTWERRRALYTECAKYEFALLPEERDWAVAEEELRAFVLRLLNTKLDLSLPHTREGTFFLSLTYSDISNAVAVLPALTEGVHALELRVDLLASQEPDFIRVQLALLRRYVPPLPVIFTVRSREQGACFA